MTNTCLSSEFLAFMIIKYVYATESSLDRTVIIFHNLSSHNLIFFPPM